MDPSRELDSVVSAVIEPALDGLDDEAPVLAGGPLVADHLTLGGDADHDPRTVGVPQAELDVLGPDQIRGNFVVIPRQFVDLAQNVLHAHLFSNHAPAARRNRRPRTACVHIHGCIRAGNSLSFQKAGVIAARQRMPPCPFSSVFVRTPFITSSASRRRSSPTPFSVPPSRMTPASMSMSSSMSS